MNVKLRFFGFALAVVLLASLVGWAGRSAWQLLAELRTNFAAVQSESFHFADHVEASILNLNETVLRFDLTKDPAERAHFNQVSRDLKLWIHNKKSSVTTPLEASLLDQIDQALDDYLSRTTQLLDQRAQAGSLPSTNEVLEKVENKSQLLHLCAQLKSAEQTALTRFVENSYQALGGSQRLLVALVVLILVLGVTSANLIYRIKIAPLRAQLVESQAVIERQEKLASLGTLAAGVAHEIRNPLTAINVRLHSLKRTLVRGSSEHEDATVIDQEIQRLDRIVREVLHFARPAEPRPIAILATTLLARVKGLLAAQLLKNSIQLHLPPSSPLWIRVDPQQLEQVLINLIQNAAESIGHDGTITLHARSALMPSARDAAPAVVLEVIDTGKGIPREIQSRLFDPFFTTKETGTGLGLSIAARIIDKHGGSLHYRTEVDHGTTFSIALPRIEHSET